MYSSPEQQSRPVFAHVHPQYDRYRYIWERIRDAYEGQDRVKYETVKYLPPTTGMAKPSPYGPQMTPEGWYEYQGYISRAQFPGDTAQMVRTALGILWNKDATIEVPKRMEYIKEQATSEGDSLTQLMVDVNIEQLLPGRCGLLADLPAPVNGVLLKGKPEPFITMYKCEQILNWDLGARGLAPFRQLNLVVLDESENERAEDMSIRWQNKYLVLSLGSLAPNDTAGTYHVGRFRDENFVNQALRQPLIYNKPLPFIPFTFINATNIKPKVDAPPHIDLVDLCFSLYQNSADYEQMLHEHAQETLVVEGGDEDKAYRVGTHATICTPGNGNKAYFIGLNGKGLPEMAKAYANKQILIERKSGQMVDTRSLQRESGESLKTRLAAQTATLSQIAKASGWGFTRCLQQIAVMTGCDPREVKVKPNTNFLNPELFAKTLVELMQAKNMGYPITDEDLYRLGQERGVNEKDFAAAMALLKGEPKALVTSGQPVGNPSGKSEPVVVEGESAKIAAKAKATNPTGSSPRGKTRNPRSNSK